MVLMGLVIWYGLAAPRHALHYTSHLQPSFAIRFMSPFAFVLVVPLLCNLVLHEAIFVNTKILFFSFLFGGVSPLVHLNINKADLKKLKICFSLTKIHA